MNIEPMEHHGPGWQATSFNGVLYQLWAPQDKAPEGSNQPPRSFWQAAWTSETGGQGDLWRGSTATDVLHIFPKRIAQQFKEAI